MVDVEHLSDINYSEHRLYVSIWIFHKTTNIYTRNWTSRQEMCVMFIGGILISTIHKEQWFYYTFVKCFKKKKKKKIQEFIYLFKEREKTYKIPINVVNFRVVENICDKKERKKKRKKHKQKEYQILMNVYMCIYVLW